MLTRHVLWAAKPPPTEEMKICFCVWIFGRRKRNSEKKEKKRKKKKERKKRKKEGRGGAETSKIPQPPALELLWFKATEQPNDGPSRNSDLNLPIFGVSGFAPPNTVSPSDSRKRTF